MGVDPIGYQCESNNSLKQRVSYPEADLQFPKERGLLALGHKVAQMLINHCSFSVVVSKAFIPKIV
jgi:hypothetical protein